mgnify:CR=1 FL=1
MRFVLTGLLAAFCLFDSYGKLFPTTEVLAATDDLGFPRSGLTLIGVLMLVGIVLFVVPRATFLGAVWLSAYFGGAFATMVAAASASAALRARTVALSAMPRLKLRPRQPLVATPRTGSAAATSKSPSNAARAPRCARPRPATTPTR